MLNETQNDKQLEKTLQQPADPDARVHSTLH
jgi:hypothetical protein